MQRRLTGMLLAVAFGLPAAAQTQSVPTDKPEGPTEKIWLLETSGLGGWGAASRAIRVRATLDKIRGLREVEFDTTGNGYFYTIKGFEPTAEILEEALADARLSAIKIKSLKEVELPKTVARLEVSVKGLAWMGSAMKAREAFSEIEGVTRVLAYGHNGKVHIYCSDTDALSKDLLEDKLRSAGMAMRKVRRI